MIAFWLRFGPIEVVVWAVMHGDLAVMGKYRYVFDEERTRRFIAEGRGRGILELYFPWITIRDLSSLGRSHRVFGIKTNRVHHLLSDGEWKCFLKFEADRKVLDIREQFPMDRLQTFQEALRLGYKHPVTTDGTPYMMTIDFLVTEQTDNGPVLKPYTFKYDPDGLKPREKQLIEIASAFWRRHSLELITLDQSFFDEPLVINYDSVRAYYHINNLDSYCTTNMPRIAACLRAAFAQGSSETLAATCIRLAQLVGVDRGIVYAVAMHLIARDAVRVNLSSPIGLERLPLHAFHLVDKRTGV